jgi:hypothetical protein
MMNLSDPFDLWLMSGSSIEDCDCKAQNKPHLWLRFGLADCELISSSPSSLFPQNSFSVRFHAWKNSSARKNTVPIPLYWFGDNCLFNERQFKQAFPKKGKKKMEVFDVDSHIDNFCKDFWLNNAEKIETMQDILQTSPQDFDSGMPRCHEWVSYVLTYFEKMEGEIHPWTPNFSLDDKLSKLISSLIESVAPHSCHAKNVQVVRNRLLKHSHLQDLNHFYAKIPNSLLENKDDEDPFPKCRFLHAGFLHFAKRLTLSTSRVEFFSKAFSFLPKVASTINEMRQSATTPCGQRCEFCAAIVNPLHSEFESLQKLCEYTLSGPVLKNNIAQKYKSWIKEITEKNAIAMETSLST